LAEKSDHHLMLAVRDGDLDKLGHLFEKHHKRLYNFYLWQVSTGSKSTGRSGGRSMAAVRRFNSRITTAIYTSENRNRTCPHRAPLGGGESIGEPEPFDQPVDRLFLDSPTGVPELV